MIDRQCFVGKHAGSCLIVGIAVCKQNLELRSVTVYQSKSSTHVISSMLYCFEDVMRSSLTRSSVIKTVISNKNMKDNI